MGLEKKVAYTGRRPGPQESVGLVLYFLPPPLLSLKLFVGLPLSLQISDTSHWHSSPHLCLPMFLFTLESQRVITPLATGSSALCLVTPNLNLDYFHEVLAWIIVIWMCVCLSLCICELACVSLLNVLNWKYVFSNNMLKLCFLLM